MTGVRHPVIRTPDQRIRVFVSSTLRELAAERHAARTAIERMHLAPVMFELGARPHPPRELYRSYLEQSDVFVGICTESSAARDLPDQHRTMRRAIHWSVSDAIRLALADADREAAPTW